MDPARPRRSVRPALSVLLVLLLAPVQGAPHPEAFEDALDWLAAEPPQGAVAVEAIAGAGLDPFAWPPADPPLRRLQVPADTASGIRAVHAVAASGHDPTAWPPDAPRDLLQEARSAQVEGVGPVSFALLALVHGGGDPRDDLVDALLDAQQEDGGWGCHGPSSTDCTGFALAALAAAGRLTESDTSAAAAFLDRHVGPDGGVRADDALDTPNTNSAAWAMHAWHALGRPVPDAVWDWVLARQTPEGGFAWADVEDGPDAHATLDLLPLLAGRPLPWPVFRAAQVDVVPPAGPGEEVQLSVRGDGLTHATWTGPAATANGTDARMALPGPGVHVVHVHATGQGIHFRAAVPVEVQAADREAPVPLLPVVLLLVALAWPRRA